MKPAKVKTFHTPSSPKGMGDFQGTGVKNPVGKMVDTYMSQPNSSEKKKAPLTLA